ncbi:MAG: DUF4333 domain-containing protein [Solirubrobacteraceae bacterium]|nr:DUF4333 domain-containing protein [Solirubrobacteraceae bacterium]
MRPEPPSSDLPETAEYRIPPPSTPATPPAAPAEPSGSSSDDRDPTAPRTGAGAPPADDPDATRVIATPSIPDAPAPAAPAPTPPAAPAQDATREIVTPPVAASRPAADARLGIGGSAVPPPPPPPAGDDAAPTGAKAILAKLGSTKVRIGIFIAIVVIVVIGVVGGGKSVPREDVEKQLADHPALQGAESVDCPDDLKGEVGARMTCQARGTGQTLPVTIEVTKVEDDRGHYEIVEIGGQRVPGS